MSETIFGKILAGEIPADIVYEDDQTVAFRDVNPVGPVHVLVIPRRPLTSLAASGPEDTELLGHLLAVCRQVAVQEGIADDGYRVITNIGRHGGQSVDHLHFHVVGGRGFGWPPG